MRATDVVIVGAGLSGLAAARSLASRRGVGHGARGSRTASADRIENGAARRRTVDRTRRAVGRPRTGSHVRADRRTRPDHLPDVRRRRDRARARRAAGSADEMPRRAPCPDIESRSRSSTSPEAFARFDRLAATSRSRPPVGHVPTRRPARRPDVPHVDRTGTFAPAPAASVLRALRGGDLRRRRLGLLRAARAVLCAVRRGPRHARRRRRRSAAGSDRRRSGSKVERTPRRGTSVGRVRLDEPVADDPIRRA